MLSGEPQCEGWVPGSQLWTSSAVKRGLSGSWGRVPLGWSPGSRTWISPKPITGGQGWDLLFWPWLCPNPGTPIANAIAAYPAACAGGPIAFALLGS